MSDLSLALADGEFDIKQLTRTNPEKAAILIDAQIKQHVADEREGWIARALMIYYLKEKELWRYHPENFKSFYEYCMQPEIDIAPSIASDMLAIVKHAPHLEAAGIDIWEVIRRAGPSKVRQIIPQIREAHRAKVLEEQITPLVAAIDSMSFREVLEMTSTSGVRTQYDLAAVVQETPDGGLNILFQDVDVDDLEYLARKLAIKRWYDQRGNRIEPPLNEPDLKMLKE